MRSAWLDPAGSWPRANEASSVGMVKPVSKHEFDAHRLGSLPQSEEIRPGIWTLPLRKPGYIPSSFSYLISDDNEGIHIIDPGWNSEENWAALENRLVSLGRQISNIKSVTVTHLHSDHLGMSKRIRNHSGATIALHHREQLAINWLSTQASRHSRRSSVLRWGIPHGQLDELQQLAATSPDVEKIGADALLSHGDVLPIPGRTLQVVWSPGHTPGHICIADPENSLFFSGDLVLPAVHPAIGLGGLSSRNPLAQYLDSLSRLHPFESYEVCPGHGYRFIGVVERARQTTEHHQRRSVEIASIAATTPGGTVWEIASQVQWSAGWSNLHGIFRYFALSQVATHVAYINEQDVLGAGHPQVRDTTPYVRPDRQVPSSRAGY